MVELTERSQHIIDKGSIQFTIKAESQTIARLGEVAEYLKEDTGGSYANKTEAIRYLLRLGYHTHINLIRESNPNIDPELRAELDDLTVRLYRKLRNIDTDEAE